MHCVDTREAKASCVHSPVWARIVTVNYRPGGGDRLAVHGICMSRSLENTYPLADIE